MEPIMKANKAGRSIRIPWSLRGAYSRMGYVVEPYDDPETEKTAEELKYEVDELQSMTLAQLKEKAKSLNVYSKSLKTRDLLIEAINKAGDNEEPA